MYVSMYSQNDYIYHDFSYLDSQNGLINYKEYDLSKVNTYIFNISLKNANCSIDNLKTLYLTTPKYNEFSSYVMCNDLSKDFYYCNKYVTTEFDETKFFKEIDNYQKKQEKNEVVKSSKKNKYLIFYIIGGSIATILIMLIVVKFYRKKGRVKHGKK